MFNKIARHGSPVNHQAWREIVDEFDTRLEFMAESEDDEAMCDNWLENPFTFKDAEVSDSSSGMHTAMLRRPQTGGMGLRRASDVRPKIASSSDWDQEFADAKAHASSVLKNLGNA